MAQTIKYNLFYIKGEVMPVSKHITKKQSNREWQKKKNKRIARSKFSGSVKRLKEDKEYIDAQKRIAELTH